MTALDIAEEHGSLEISALLLRHGAQWPRPASRRGLVATPGGRCYSRAMNRVASNAGFLPCLPLSGLRGLLLRLAR